MSRRHQTVQQRKAVKNKIKSQEQIVEAHYRQQARSEIATRWSWLFLLHILFFIGIGIILSVMSRYKEYVAQWMVTGEIPPISSTSLFFYVLITGILVASFLITFSMLDTFVERKIAKRKAELLAIHRATEVK